MQTSYPPNPTHPRKIRERNLSSPLMKKREKGPHLKEIFEHSLVNLVLSLIKYIQRTTTHTLSLFLYVGLDGGFFPSAKSINPHLPHKKITTTH